MIPLVALIAGLVFGVGLAVSNMMDPAKVLNFLDITGSWDPSLLLVMGGAVAITLPGFRFILKRPHPLLDRRFYVPDATVIDRPLVLGAALFGLGWGIVGFCPGPAIAAMATGDGRVFGFVLMMLLGYRITCYFETRRTASREG